MACRRDARRWRVRNPQSPSGSQVAHGAATKIDAVRASRVDAGGPAVSVGQLLSSEHGVGLLTDRAVHRREGATQRTVAAAIPQFLRANPPDDLRNAAWAVRAEAPAVAALEAMNRRRARSFAQLSHQHRSFSP